MERAGPPSSGVTNPGPCLWSPASPLPEWRPVVQGVVEALPVDLAGRVGRELCLFRGEDEGRLRCTLAVFAAQRNVGTAAWARPHLASFGTGSEDPQSGQVRPFSRAIRVARRFCRSESRALSQAKCALPRRLDASGYGRAEHGRGDFCM